MGPVGAGGATGTPPLTLGLATWLASASGMGEDAKWQSLKNHRVFLPLLFLVRNPSRRWASPSDWKLP